MKRILLFPIVLIAALFLATACTDDGDMSQPRTLCGIGIYNPETFAAQQVDSIRVKVIGPDSVLYSAYSGTTLSLPLRYVGNTSVFEIQRGTRTPDTLTILHKNIPHFLSMDAGYAMYYELQNVSSTLHTLTKVSLTTSTINTNEQENIAIYYTEY